MDRYLCACDVFEDAVVGGGFAALVVLGLEAVDRDDDIELLELFPLGGDDAEGAGDDLGVNSAALDLGQEEFELAITNERIAAYEGDVEGLVLVDEGEDFSYEFVALEVGELAELGFAAEVGCVEGVATGAAQGAFFGDFDG